MKRREFVLFAASMGALLGSARGEGRIPVIGFLGPTGAAVAANRINAFEDRLRELGRVPGKTCVIEYRWAEGQTARFSELAIELLKLRVDVIVTWGGATAVAIKKVSSDTPIVFTIVDDPVRSGLVASLTHPGGNVTGISTQHPDSVGKRLQVLGEALPGLRRLGVLLNELGPGDLEELQALQAVAEQAKVALLPIKVKTPEEIQAGVALAKKEGDALYIVSDALFNNSRKEIAALTLSMKLPTVCGFKEIVAAGALMSYGPEFLVLFRRAADLVDKILRGERPRDIPV